MMRKTLEELGIEVKESRSHGLAGPTILPESNIQCIDLYFNMEKIPFQEFSYNSGILDLINERLDFVRSQLKKSDSSLSVLTAEESSWQLVFVNNSMSNDFSHPKIIEEWRNLGQMFSYARRNESSTLRNMKSVVVNVSGFGEWNYLLDKERVSAPLLSFLFPVNYANKGKIFVSSLGMGYGFMDAKIWNIAAKEFEIAIKNWPKEDKRLYPKTVSVLGGCYENLGEVDKAVEVLEKLVREGTIIALTHYNLGWAYDEKGRQTNDKEWFYRAAEQQEKAIELDPKYHDAYYNLACAYAMAGDREKAFSVVKNAKTKGVDLMQELIQDSDFRGIIG